MYSTIIILIIDNKYGFHNIYSFKNILINYVVLYYLYTIDTIRLN